MAMADESWREHAACAGQTSLFFPPVEHKQGRPWSCDEAKLICASCSVTVECLAYVMQHPKLEGVWAGLTPAEREKMQRKRRPVLAVNSL